MPKMSNKWVAICTAAVGVTYAAGYVVTQPSLAQASAPVAQNSTPDHSNSLNQTNPNSTHNNAPSNPYYGNNNSNQDSFYGRHRGHDRGGDGSFPPFGGTDNGSSNSSSSNNTTTGNGSTRSASGSVTYKDGTYTGTGMNRYGTVSVSVTIKSKKITSVQITDCETHYPEQAIAGLPQEVIDRQTANVDIVSGATGSSEDFQQAVAQALQSAQN